jgi:hypothetical protein
MLNLNVVNAVVTLTQPGNGFIVHMSSQDPVQVVVISG